VGESNMKKTFIVVLLFSAIIASFFLGANLSKKAIARSIEQLQAELSFGHLKMYSDIQSDLKSNCRSRADSRLEFVINEQKMRMAEYVQNNVIDKKFEDYITLRDSNLIEELRSYEVDWSKEWILPNCKKAQ
jgi:peptidoglycan hydrolase CwlO-like protein